MASKFVRPYSLAEFSKSITKKLCLYIHGDPKKSGSTICSRKRKDGSYFCPEHHKLCFYPIPPAKSRTKEFFE